MSFERAVKEAIRPVPQLGRETHQSNGVCHSLPEAREVTMNPAMLFRCSWPCF